MVSDSLLKVFDKFGGLSVGVLGDFALDAYWILDGEVGEISVETAKRAYTVTSQRYSPGGAGNITANVAELKIGRVEAFGVRGDDPFGVRLDTELRKRSVDTSGIIVQTEKWDTHVWAKPHMEGEELRRLDFGYFNELAVSSLDALFARLETRVESLDALIVNQQLPRPLVAGPVIERVNGLISRHPQKVIVIDSRKEIDRYRGAILKIDQASLIRRHRGLESLDQNAESYTVDDVRQAAAHFYGGYPRPIVITRGRRGCLVWENGELTEVPAVFVTGPVDPVGAGHTLLAALASGLAAGLSVTEAAMLGNWAASVTVTKLKQTGTATPAEIRSRMENSRLVFRPDLATDQRKARYLSGTRIEIVNPEIDRGRIRQVIFDHDGTVSTLRQGWEPIMEEVMLEQIFGTTYATVPAAEFFRVKRRVAEFIDQSTGIQTIIQMQGLADLVAELGYVSKDKILDPVGYKAIYNEKLLEMVNERIARLDAGELAEEDFILKGTLAFMKALKKRTGATFYLASGTDQQDVEIEAGRLGYAALFDGGIYGAKGDIEKFSKKKLMAQIIRDHGLEGPELCTFGDGPVEISECKRNRGIAVGVASDELRRWGLNPAKRERLVKAGADVIVADFTQWEMLLDWLMGK